MNPLEDYFWNKPHTRPTNRWMHYLPIYHRHFERFRGTAPKVLEIGVSAGGGFYMWRDYFGQDAEIIGIDVNEKSRESAGKDFPIYIGDQVDTVLLDDIQKERGPFDIIIDDGGHKVSQMIGTFEALYHKVTARGVYLVEDTHANCWGGFKDTGETTFLDYAFGKSKELLDWSKHIIFDVERFKMAPEKREGELPASDFCKTSESVCFYDSIVVFERALRVEPHMVAR